MSNGPQVPGIGYETQHAMQAETALVTSQAAFFPLLVSAFNDLSVEQVSPPEIQYVVDANNVERRFLYRGVSLMGWSTSGDAGSTWEYRGKVRPPWGWSATWGDPSLAVDPTQRSVVYYAALGVSDEAWGNSDWKMDDRPFVDGVCVARSGDGGASFPQVRCVKMADFGVLYGAKIDFVDKTAITVDGLGRVWLATFVQEGFLAGIRLLRSASKFDWETFSLVPPYQAGLYEWPGDQEPSLVTDSAGDPWLGALSGPSALFRRFVAATGESAEGFRLDSDCDMKNIFSGEPTIGTDLPLRNAYSYYVAAGLNEQHEPAIRVAAQVRQGDSTIVHLRVVEWTAADGCRSPAAWSTEWDAGKQFQPTMHYVGRGDVPTWWLAYLTTSGVPDPSKNYLHPEALKVTSSASEAGRTYSLANRAFLAPADWYACPQRVNGYWGDYFGMTQLKDTGGKWWSVAAFSDSRPAPACGAASDFYGNPLHVAASRW